MIRITSNAKEVARALQTILNGITALPIRNRSALRGITRQTIQRNHGSLAWGRSIRDADGRNVRWTRSRYPFTKDRRRSAGLGPVFPLLHFTGKLQNELMRGGRSFSKRVSRNESIFRYESSNSPLLEVHEKGLQSIGEPSVPLPPRPSIFWSQAAEKQVQKLFVKDLQRLIKKASGA